jgi:heme/copper-type cytochrome/quinol oxidase subunit 4
MNQKKFVERLSQLESAISDKGTLYTKIHIVNDIIFATLSSDKKAEININQLYWLYKSEDTISEDVLLKYPEFNNKVLVTSLLKASGLYNKKGMKANFYNRTKKHVLSKKFTAFVTLLIPFFIISGAIVYYSPASTSNIAKSLIIFTLVIINGSFFIFLFMNRKEESDDFTYSALFSLMILNVGIFPLFNYIKDYKERNTETVHYTVGFRSWGTKAVYSNIKVRYYDKFGNPYILHDSIVNNSNNWISLIWTDSNEDNKLIMQADTAFNVKDKDGILNISLTNCGAILKPEVFDNKVTNFSVSSNIHLAEVDPLYIKGNKSERYESSQICLKVPYYLYPEKSILEYLCIEKPKDINHLKASEIYYGFEFLYSKFSWSKLRIPAFNFDYTETELDYRLMIDPNDKYAQHTIKGIKNTILYDTINEHVSPVDTGATIRLSASLIGENASFYLYKASSTHSLPLFNFRIPDYSAFEIK